MDKGAASDVPTTGKTGINGGGEIHLATSVITSMEGKYIIFHCHKQEKYSYHPTVKMKNVYHRYQ